MVPVGGDVDARFGPVRDAFVGLADPGSALAVVRDGATVVDLHGGWRDAARTRPWTPDTLVHVFSVGKAVVAAALVHLADSGRLDLDDPVVRHWPQFRTPETTVRHVLAHAAGLPAFPGPPPVEAAGDWHRLAGALAGAEPEFPPGSAVAEHAVTYGHLVGELIRRVDGRLPGEYVRAELAGPWGLELAFGATPAEQARAAELEYASPDWPAIAGEPGSYRHRVVDALPGWLALDVLNSPAWRAAQVPAVNLHTTALSMARFYAGLLAGGELDGVRLLGPAAAAAIRTTQAAGRDLLLDRHVNWGLGVQIDGSGQFGMGGIGGCDAFADPARGYAYAYVTRSLGGFDRTERLIEAVEKCL